MRVDMHSNYDNFILFFYINWCIWCHGYDQGIVWPLREKLLDRKSYLMRVRSFDNPFDL